MANSQKEFKTNRNVSDDQPISLEEIKAILFKVLTKKAADEIIEIIKALPMYSFCT